MENVVNHLADKHLTDQPCGSFWLSDSALTIFEEEFSNLQDRCGRGYFANLGHWQVLPVKAQKVVLFIITKENFLRSSCTVSGTKFKFGKSLVTKESARICFPLKFVGQIALPTRQVKTCLKLLGSMST